MELVMEPALERADAGNKAALPAPAAPPKVAGLQPAAVDQHALTKSVGKETRAKVCQRCGSKKLRPQHTTLLHKLLAVRFHLCSRCKGRQLGFQYHGLSLATVFTLLIMLSGTVYLYKNPLLLIPGGADAEQHTAEALARARVRTGSLSAFEEMMIKRPQTTMDNGAILKLWKANVGSEVMIKLVHASVPDYDLSADRIIELHVQGVDQSVILAMIDATYTPSR